MSKTTKPMSHADADLLASLTRGLEQTKAGQFAAIHTPEQITARRRGRPPLEATKKEVKLRIDPDVVDALRATGTGWQTRINDMLRASLQLAGKL
ncbi:MAG: BrnA antitoxin family protein [Brachymonas sp.]|nr:BrnA antitoxin family protein [Brachymonas sp.]